MTDQPPLVRLHGASFGYTDRPVVSGVDLELHQREVVALLGVQEGRWPDLLGRTDLLGADELLQAAAGLPATVSRSAGLLADELPNATLLEANSSVELRVAPERLTGAIGDFIDTCWRPRAARRARARAARS